ncbi:MAG: CBS domain-containing protein [Cyclobacteriaceae bacterium]
MNFRPNLSTESKTNEYESVVKYMVPVKDLVTVGPDQSINEVIDLILEKRISGAPVLDEARKLVGMISEKDCLKIIVDQAYHNQPMSSPKVSDYMTTNVKTLSPKHDVVDAANEFLSSPIRRMPIVENGVLIGQVSRRDILKASKNISPTK